MYASQRRAKLAQLERERADLAHQKDELLAQAEAIQSDIDDKTEAIASLSPVYTLPDELVLEVLTIAYQHHFPHCRLDDGLPHTHSPLAISHVSRWWRHHALSLSRIWNCIHLTPQQSEQHVELVKLYVARSGDRPLSIFLVAYEEEAIHDITAALMSEFGTNAWARHRRAWQCLLAHKARWRHCALYTNSRRQLEAVLKTMSGQVFPQLEYLAIAGPPSDGRTPQGSNLVLHAPRVTALRITHALPPRPLQPFTHITDLTLENTPLHRVRFMECLAKASRTLQRLTLNFIRFYLLDLEADAVLPDISLPRLTVLVAEFVRDYNSSCGVVLALCRDAPALHTLRVSLSQDFLGGLAAGQLCLPGLRHLLYNGLPMRMGKMPACPAFFAALPALETLQVALVDWAGALQATVRADEHSEFRGLAWPELKTLVFYSLGEAPALLSFVEHRARMGRPLRRIVLDDANVCRVSDHERQQYESYGLKIVGYSQASGAIQFGARALQTWWDSEKDRPSFSLWNGEWEFWDQFE